MIFIVVYLYQGRGGEKKKESRGSTKPHEDNPVTPATTTTCVCCPGSLPFTMQQTARAHQPEITCRVAPPPNHELCALSLDSTAPLRKVDRPILEFTVRSYRQDIRSLQKSNTRLELKLQVTAIKIFNDIVKNNYIYSHLKLDYIYNSTALSYRH